MKRATGHGRRPMRVAAPLSAAQWRAWLAAHRRAAADVAAQFRRAPAAHLLTVAVIAVALALPLALYVLVEHLRGLPEQWSNRAAQVSLYLKPSVTDADAVTFAAGLNGRPGIAAVELITRQEAYNEYRELAGFAEALAALEDNPLPALVVVDPADAGGGGMLLKDLRKLPQVEVARIDSEWLQRLHAIVGLARRGVLLLGGVLALAVALIVGHTIRLAVVQRHEEIEIAKLFGATDAFIRRPLLYLGFCFGGLGGLAACVLVAAALLALDAPVRELASFYQSDFSLRAIAARLFGLGSLGSGLLGLAGAWLAVAHHLRRVDIH